MVKNKIMLTAFRLATVVNGNTNPPGNHGNVDMSGHHGDREILGEWVTLTEQVVQERDLSTQSSGGVVEWTQDSGRGHIVQT